ncbi:MAG: T9SS type A sorting domain-containing protein [Saprospiraceae bacterium]
MSNPKTRLILALLLIPFFLFAQQRLTITPHMVINTSARGNAWHLFDNQSVSNECIPARSNDEWQFYDATWNGQTFFYPVTVVVDFGSQQPLNQVCLREGWGYQTSVKMEVSNYPTTWQEVFTHFAGQGECHSFGVQNARFVRFTFASNQARIREIEIYGPQPNTAICPPAATHTGFPELTMEDFIGVNTNIDIPPVKTLPFGFIRNYQGIFANTGYDDPDAPLYPNNEYGWAPNNSGRFDFDVFFSSLKDLNKTVTATIHRAPPNLVTFQYHNGDSNYNAAVPFANEEITLTQFYNSVERKPFSERFYPIESGMIVDDPNAYLEFADIFYQFTARYGNQNVMRPLKLQADNQQKSGLGYVDYIENWNEPDKWWHVYLMQGLDYLNPEIEQQLGYFRPAEYAAMSAATIDGNGRNNGVENIITSRYPNGAPANAGPVSIRSADPNMKLVMAGLSEPNVDYVRAMKFWFDYYRPDLEFPFQAINFHDYSNDSNNGNAIGRYAVSPEEDRLREKLEKVVDYRNRYLPGVEVWLSEFGYDTNPYSPQSPDCERWCGDCNAPDCIDKMRELQGQWLVRSYLELAAAGVDRAMMFTIRDGAPENLGGLYSTAGLTTWADVDSNGYNNKPAWYYVATMKDALENTKYDPTFQHLDPNVRAYRFLGQNGKRVYAIWSPTSWQGTDQAIYSDYNLTFIDPAAKVVSMQAGEVDGVAQTIRQCNGVPCINISERPIFIVENGDEEDLAGCDCNYLNFSILGDNNFQNLVDEQNKLTGLYCGDAPVMQTHWTPNAMQEAVIDFGEEVELSDLFLHGKRFRGGQLEISYGSPNNWTFWRTWDSENLIIDQWKVYNEVGVKTRYIRLQAKGTNLNIGEFAACGKSSNSNPTPTCTDGIQNGNETDIDCGGNCPPCTTDGDCMITISDKDFYYPNGQSATGGDAGGSLADEQDLVEDVLNGAGGEPTQPWQSPWQSNAQVYLDLGQEYDLKDIYLYDGYGGGRFTVAPGLPSENRAPIVDFNADAWPPQWRQFPLNTRVRHLTFTKVDLGAKINEIALCGTPANGVEPLLNRDRTPRKSPLPHAPYCYPNPAQSAIFFPMQNGLKSIEIYDVNGRLMKAETLKHANAETLGSNVSTGVQRISTADFSNGIYLVKMQSDSGNVYQKLVIQQPF